MADRRQRWGLVAAMACVVVACGGGSGQPPRGPEYTPVNSPEPPTACETEREAAKAGRERSLDDSSAAARAGTASAVLAHLECELAQLRTMSIPRGSQDAIMVEIRVFRDQFQTALTLADEVRRYGDPGTTVGAWVRTGDLNRMYAQKLRAAPAPVDLRPAQRSAFVSELIEIAIGLERQAALAYVSAVEAGSDVEDIPGGPVAGWVSEACAGLEAVAPDAARRRVACGRR